MIDPKAITTSGIEVTQVLANTGIGGYSVCRLRYANGATALGMRWNGGRDENDRGYPSARGYPVFFTIPDDLHTAIEDALVKLS